MRRTSLLTYWTGKDVEIEVKHLNEGTRSEYLERLRSILEHGIWMNEVNEEVIGLGKPARIKMQIAMTCFTELRLSQSQEHNKRYGLMGIVVDREFVLARRGGPVFYVRSREDDTIVGNFVQLFQWVREQAQLGTPKAEAVFKNGKVLVTYLKAMSASSSDDYENLNENEWRIVHTYMCEKAGLIKATGMVRPNYKIPLSPTDIKMIVLPDSQTRDKVLSDTRIAEWFEKRFPPLLTVTEVSEF